MTQGLHSALSKIVGIVGAQFAYADERLEEVNSATFSTRARSSAIVLPGSSEELREIISIARQEGIPVYPVSGGKNWGLGSRIPPTDTSILIDLSRLNRIIDWSEELGYLVVEPGVTFSQASEFLLKQGSSWFLSVIGGPPSASIIGNSLERGEGLGPRGLRPTSLCALEVLLANGEYLHTGFSAEGSRAKHVSPWNVGPSVDGLFYQSNLGIVTKATIWLQKKPEAFQSFCIACNSNNHFVRLIPKLQFLVAQGIIRPCSLALWNSYKFLASQQQFPWEHFASTRLTKEELQRLLPRQWQGTLWFGFGALYSASSLHAQADRQVFTRMIRPFTSRLIVINKWKAALAQFFQKPLSRITGMDVKQTVESLFSRSVYLGHPMTTSLRSMYWRKRTPIPEKMDADRDRCGILWLCHIVPFQASDISEAAKIVEEEVISRGFEPNIALLAVSERCFHMFVVIMYDREIPGEDERAISCHDVLFQKLNDAGFSAYRLGIQSLENFSELVGNEQSLIGHLRQRIDPEGIISPGRYES